MALLEPKLWAPEKLHPTNFGYAISDGNISPIEDHLVDRKRYRIPTTVAGQIYELRRMFRL